MLNGRNDTSSLMVTARLVISGVAKDLLMQASIQDQKLLPRKLLWVTCEQLCLMIILMSFGLFFQPSWSASHHPQDLLNSIVGSKTEGQQIVQEYCATCHAVKPLIQLGAPRIGDVSDWKPRLKQDLQQLFKHTDEGVNAMPARGGCFECTDQQLMLAILAMLPKQYKANK